MNFPLIFVGILGIISLIYAGVLAGFIRGLMRLRKNPIVTPVQWPFVSIIVPARNEAAVLQRTLNSLLQQDYPGPWEIIVVDDRSSDETPQILSQISAQCNRINVVTITEVRPASPKKNAIARGIKASHGEIIVTTDADCVYDSSWLRSMLAHMTSGVGVVAGLTEFDLPIHPIPIWQKIQWLDFIVQQFMAAGAIGHGVPSSCNGSNLAYRREVYDEISGFGTTAAQISGDDVLFAQRVAKLTAWKTVFATAPESIVKSLPVLTIREMFYQRFRWASKGMAYRRSMSIFLFGIYAYYAMWLTAPVIAFLYPGTLPAIAAIMLWKLLWDYGTIRLGAGIFRQQHLLPYFVPFEFLHIFFSPIFGIGGLFASYRWKGEWYRTARLPRGLRLRLVRARRRVRQRRTVQTTV